MSVEETELTIREYLAALLNGATSPRSSQTMCCGRRWRPVIKSVERMRSGISSLRFTASISMRRPSSGSVVVGDGVAALEAVFVGTHIADFAGVPATGVSVRCPYVVSYDVSAGRITPCARTSRSRLWLNS